MFIFSQEAVRVFDKLYGPQKSSKPSYTFEDAVARAYMTNCAIHGMDSIYRLVLWVRLETVIRLDIYLKVSYTLRYKCDELFEVFECTQILLNTSVIQLNVDCFL